MLPAGDPPQQTLRAPAHLLGEEEGAEGCRIHPAEAPPTANQEQHAVPMGMVTRTGL